MVEICQVYELSFPNGKSYIGVTANINDRLKDHRKQRSLVGKAIRKHGEQIPKTLLIGDREYCYFIEQELIEVKNTLPPFGYNLLIGGGGNSRHSLQTRLKMSNARRGAKHTEETKEKLRIAGLRENLSFETRQRKSIASSGWVHSPETRKKMSISQKAAWIKRKANG